MQAIPVLLVWMKIKEWMNVFRGVVRKSMGTQLLNPVRLLGSTKFKALLTL